MSHYYVDSSALAKRYLTEVGSIWLQSLVDPQNDNVIITAAITRVEVASALAARHRASKGLTIDERDGAVSLLIQHCHDEYLMIPVGAEILDLALTLTQNHRLRAYDAIQLATALIANAQLLSADLPALTFIAADTDLLTASRDEGLEIDNPNDQPDEIVVDK